MRYITQETLDNEYLGTAAILREQNGLEVLYIPIMNGGYADHNYNLVICADPTCPGSLMVQVINDSGGGFLGDNEEIIGVYIKEEE